jgi:hypothetical protein
METSQKNLCTKDTTLKDPQEGSKAIVRLYHTYAYSFNTKKLNPYEISNTCESGTLYNTKKARYFLMELDKDADLLLTRKNFFTIYTNDIDMTNDLYLTFTFTINRQFSPDVVKKYFKRLRQLLLDEMLAVKNRLSSESDKNRQTNLYSI